MRKLKSCVASDPEYAVQLDWLTKLLASSRLLIALVLVGHLGGCAWYAAGTTRMFEKDDDHVAHSTGWVWKNGWMEERPFHNPNGIATPFMTNHDGWVEPMANRSGFYAYAYDPRSSDYLFTRYFTAVFDVLVDAEQDKASTDAELVTGLLLHLIYEAINGFVIGTLTTMVMESRRSKKDYEDKINMVTEFCAYHKLSTKVTHRICTFYSKAYPDEMIIADEDELLAELPPTLRNIVRHHLYADTVARVPVFKALESDTREQICQFLQPTMCAPGDIILREGDKAAAMYFIIVSMLDLTFRTRASQLHFRRLTFILAGGSLQGHSGRNYAGTAWRRWFFWRDGASCTLGERWFSHGSL